MHLASPDETYPGAPIAGEAEQLAKLTRSPNPMGRDKTHPAPASQTSTVPDSSQSIPARRGRATPRIKAKRVSLRATGPGDAVVSPCVGRAGFEDVKVGDLVVSRDEKTGVTSPRPIVRLFQNK